MQQETSLEVRVEPPYTQWIGIPASPQGELLGRSLSSWRKSAKQSLGLPVDMPIVIVGHQPTFFHPGILAKFIAGHHVAAQIGGALTFLVVDHQMGITGNIDIPVQVDEDLTIREVRVGILDAGIAIKDQDRVEVSEVLEPMSSALEHAHGENAAMQYAHAIKTLMAPWATVHHVVAGCDLLATELGKAILQEMNRNPQHCINTYNEAVSHYPDCDIPKLHPKELPLWQGKYNQRVEITNGDLRPRALLLTLLARLSIGDLFIHGTGGAAYDKIMERWVQRWLSVVPCPTTMVTATIMLSPQQQTIDEARRDYFSPKGETGTKNKLVDSIEMAPYRSSIRHHRYQAMHTWLSTIGTYPDAQSFRRTKHITDRRDWAFPLYPDALLHQLSDAIIAT